MAAKLNTFSRLRVFQAINRDCRSHLTLSERDFLFYLADNSVSYGRDWLRVTVEQMIEGTEWGIPALGMSRRTVFGVIASLRSKGALIVKSVTRRLNEYRINLEWIAQMSLATPKNPRKTQKTRLAGTGKEGGISGAEYALSENLGCRICTPKIDSKSTEKNSKDLRGSRNESGAALEAKPSAERLVESIKQRKHSKPASPAEAYRQAYSEGFPGENPPSLSRRELAQLKMATARFSGDGLKIIHWAVANWGGVISRQFEWMRSRPERPSAGFLLRFITDFANDYYAEAERETRWASSQEERLYRDKIKSGLSHEEALLEVGKHRALVLAREEMAKSKEFVRQSEKALAAEREHLDRQRRAIRTDPADRADLYKLAEKPAINHGSNPYETEPADAPALPELPEWQ